MVDYRNQTEIFDPDTWGYPLHLVGMGSIGSAILPGAIGMGFPEIHIYDGDRLEDHNPPSQIIYRHLSDMGRRKVDAAADFAAWLEVDSNIVVHPTMVTADTRFEGVVVSGPDSMKSRRVIWEAVKASDDVPLLIDGRIGGQKHTVLTLEPYDPKQRDIYETWLFDDSAAQELSCGARSFTGTSLALAADVLQNLALCSQGKRPKFLIQRNLAANEMPR